MKRVQMKRSLLVVAILAVANAWAWSNTEWIDGIKWPYTVENGEATIGDAYGNCQWRFDGEEPTGDVSIPSTIGGYPVTAIGGYAFLDCEKMTSVIIPEGVRHLGIQAFDSCIALTNVVIPSTVNHIGSHAFGGCHSLSDLSIPESVESIGFLAFRFCRSLDNVTIPASVTNIGGGVFALCRNLKSVGIADDNPAYVIKDGFLMSKDGKTVVSCFGDASTIPDGVTSIEDWALVGSGLTSLTLPQSVTNIGNLAFGLCENLTSVTIPANVMSIGVIPFLDSTNITSFVVAEDNPNYKSQDGYLLSKDGKTLLAGVIVDGDVTIPDGIETIGESAFEECSTLTSVTIPDSVKNIEGYAFYFCRNLKSVTFGNGVTNIGHYAFENCRSLESVKVPLSLENKIDFDDLFDDWYKPEIIYYHGLMEYRNYSDTDSRIAALRWNEVLTYDGYLYDANGVVGTIQVKRPKYTRSSKWEDKTVVAIQLLGEKKQNFKIWTGVIGSTMFDCTTKEGLRIDLEFGLFGMTGTFEEYQVIGARNIFATKVKSVKASADSMLAPWIGTLNMICDGGTLSVSVAKKGKVLVKGEVDGAKVSATTQALICENDIRIPVVYSKKGVNLAFVIRLPFDGGTAEVVGMDGAVIGKSEALKSGAMFYCDVDAASVEAKIPGVLSDYLPNGASVSVFGKKWVVDGGLKAAKVKYDRKTGQLSITPGKKGEEIVNVAGLKLTYTQKTGAFKGSFQMYSVQSNRLVKYTFQVSGVVIDGVGYGTATCKKLGAVWNVTVE